MSILGGMQGHTGYGGIIFMCSSTDGGLVLNKAKHRGTEVRSEVLFGRHPSSYEQLFYRDH